MAIANNYFGYRIIKAPPRIQKVKRTWKERLFSKPFQSHKDVIVDVLEKGKVLKDDFNMTIVVNESEYHKLCDMLKNQTKGV